MKVNLNFYKGEDLYSDGNIEKEIISYLKQESDSEKIIANDLRFPIIYHLTPIRSNIINWYPFKKDSVVLEIGAGMGALTATLCDKVKRVVSVELSKQRASAIEERCKDKENLELIIGNLNDIQFQEKFDYITLIGVFEYASLYTDSDRPFETFLEKIKGLLKEDGILLIAIENKFGLKYFAGMPEDHTTIRYDSILGYQNKKGPRTFGKEAITKLLKTVGFKYTKFYYPLPDYKLPNVIFSDEYLPSTSDLIRDKQYYQSQDIINFDEVDVYQELIKENPKLFPFFANSFFIETSVNHFHHDIKSVFFNNWRNEKYRLLTVMNDNAVVKSAISKNSLNHIYNMKQILEILEKQGLKTIDKYHNDTIVSNLINQDNYETYLLKLYEEKGINSVIEKIELFYQNLKEKLKPSDKTEIDVFEKYEIECPTDMKNNMHFIKYGIFDLRFENCFYIKNEFYFYDQEWMEQNIPLEYIIYRSLVNFHKIKIEDRNKILEKLNINDYVQLFDILEEAIVKNIRNATFSKIFTKPPLTEEILKHRMDLIQENQQLLAIQKLEEEKIQTLEQNIQEKENLYNQLINSHSFQLANVIRKGTIIPMKIVRKGKRTIRKITNKLNFTTEPNSYKRIKSYDSYYQNNCDFSKLKTDIKTLVFYLPQFHTFKENDEWWGKGFTEWTNAKKAIPRYPGHYQPRLPHDDIGYYDLSNINTLKKQVELAKQHGIYGFCFYLYWFSGKRLMEKPIDMLLEHPEIDINFCLCWANENWTRRWDGKNEDVLIAQEYSEKDPIYFIRDIKKYVEDDRYIRVDGKPVIMLYNPAVIPNVNEVIEKWREEAKKIGIGEILVWTRNLLTDENVSVQSADAEFDFPPLQKGFASSVMSGIDDGYLFNYRVLVEEMKKLYENYHHSKPIYYGTTLAWDNSSRRKQEYTIFHGFSLKSFYEWNQAVIKKTREMYPEDKRFMFVNAWNEWCEGVYLEPDKKYGYANINTLSKALFDIPFEELQVVNKKEFVSKINSKKIAVQIHLFYPDLCDEIIEQLNQIPYDYDCYITTTDNKKKNIILASFQKCSANKVIVEVTPNRGRDVAPFIIQMSKVIHQYDYICHIHSKKSRTVDYGDRWRKYLYYHLFGSKEYLAQIFANFENNQQLGIIFPEIYPVIIDQIGYYGNNLHNCKKEFKKLGISKNYINEELIFPAGTMFWAKTDAIMPLFEANYKYHDFALEKGQIDATIAHAIERIICTLASSRGYTYQKMYNNTKTDTLINKNRKVLFCHYNQDHIMMDSDLEYLKELAKISSDITLIVNKNLLESELQKLENIPVEIVKTDFTDVDKMWKDYLLNYKLQEQTEEIIITNSNQILTGLSMIPMINEIGNHQLLSIGFENESEENRNKNILMTDFLIMKKELIGNKDFQKFLNDATNDIRNELTKFLEEKKILYTIFLKETAYINQYIVHVPINQKEPYLMIILGSPIIDKNVLNGIDIVQKNKINHFLKQAKEG